jgi:glucose/arabinose dehydrogenase
MPMTKARACCVLLLAIQALVFASPGVAQQPEKGTFECRWAVAAPVIDGELNDPVWKSAALIDQFTLPWLRDKERPAKTATRARLLWDHDYLYFSAEMDDADLFADVTEHDGKTWDNDVFELFFKPAEDKTGYFEFQVNAANTIFDCFLPKRSFEDFDRVKKANEFHIDAKVKRNGTLNQRDDRDTGWTVEGRIPWMDFFPAGGRPVVNENWKFALCRYDYSVGFDGPELSTSAPLKSSPTPNFHSVEDYAPLKFVGPQPQNTIRPFGIEKRVALTTSRVIGSPEPPLPYTTQRLYPKLKTVFPVFVAPQPGSDQLVVITQDAPYSNTTLRRVKDDPEATEYEQLLAKEDVAYQVEFHPQFLQNGYLFIGSNGPGKEKDQPKSTRITRYRMDPQPPYKFDPQSAFTIIEWTSDGHNGGAMAFGKDGMFYVTSGDGTSDSDTNIVGQDITKLTAKVLRIDIDHPAADKPYSIPKDNPFLQIPDARPETWAIGLRNPWRMTMDRETGHIWVGNNGQDLWEQVYLITRGANYGWSVTEGSHPFYANRKVGPAPILLPTVEHHHSEARSLTGGIVYYGSKLPELRGAYLYGDHSTGKIWGVKHDGTKIIWHKELADTPFHITGFGSDTHGELLICDHQPGTDGAFHTLIPSPTAAPTTPFPQKLSESGLFQSVKGHVVQPALVPYSVNSPLWSDGAEKLRFVALPGGDSKIDFSLNKPWGFPDETVLVKTFALELQSGNPASKKFVETRFMVKQQGEWVGYSYQWNDDQTDATLVSKEGLDRKYTMQTPQGSHEQTWHYPSRTECMVCHSRAATFVLGLSTPQLNKNHDYAGVTDHQLRVFEHLGLFKDMSWAEGARAGFREDRKQLGVKDSEIDKELAAATQAAGQRGPATSAMLAVEPHRFERLANPYDQAEPLTNRARSYLHTNCAVCHVDAGGGNSQMQLDFLTPIDKMKIVDVVPLHDKFGKPDAKLVAPGAPDQSILLLRAALRGRGQMPQLATNLVDEAAVKMLREWIEKMPASPPK